MGRSSTADKGETFAHSDIHETLNARELQKRLLKGDVTGYGSQLRLPDCAHISVFPLCFATTAMNSDCRLQRGKRDYGEFRQVQQELWICISHAAGQIAFLRKDFMKFIETRSMSAIVRE
jgi:hypothetical protein